MVGMIMGKIDVDIKNCNNIVSGHFVLEKGKLNIKYGVNGTGKSTIASALELLSKNKPLSDLKPFGSNENDEPTVNISEKLAMVSVFNEEFVNTVVFQKSNLIENAFDVFIKTPNYDEKRAAFDNRLKALKVSIGNDDRIIKLHDEIHNFSGKLELNAAKKELKSNNYLKSILKKENLFNVPDSLKKYTPFISDKDLSINWIDWKTKGESFDQKGICPFCSDELKDEYIDEKNIFNDTYKKADSQNLKNMLDLFECFENYLDPERYSELISCIKSDPGIDTIKSLLKTFTYDFEYLKSQLEKIHQFDSTFFGDVDIDKLDESVRDLKIENARLNYFTSPLMTEIVEFVNSQIKSLEAEVTELKIDMGKLRSLMRSTIKNCSEDMNSFLNSAGIQYKVFLDVDPVGEPIAVLQYQKDKKWVKIDNIRKTLSWGERNAFALVLFMFYAQNKNADLIVLDDPISSFDSNKKYAIIHKLFAKVKNGMPKNFYKQTVLMLTHDFEPIIDFIVVGKLPQEYVSATFIQNNNGCLSERAIDKNNDIKSIIQELLCHVRNDKLCMVHRVAFLRKYYEHHGINEHIDAYYILSSLIHGRPNITSKDGTPYPPKNIIDGEKEIKKIFADFDYNTLINNLFNENELVKLYFLEKNAYLKLQLFRTLMTIVGAEDIEDVYIKFINESYHIENDYAYYLNLLEYDMVPPHIIGTIDEYMNKEYKAS